MNPTMLHLLTWAIAIIFLILGGIHVYWAAGGTLSVTAIPSKDGKPLFSPSPLTTLCVAVLLFCAAVLVLMGAGLMDLGLPSPLVEIGNWVLIVAFAGRAVGDFRYVGFFKRVRDTSFADWDTKLFSPLCLGLSLGMAALRVSA